MSRGRPPRKAIRLAREIAVTRGAVWDLSTLPGFIADLMIFSPGQIIFVRVKRADIHVTDVQQIGRAFAGELLLLGQVPETAVVSRELWLLTPWETWQFFRVGPGSITEIRRDGRMFEGEGTPKA